VDICKLHTIFKLALKYREFKSTHLYEYIYILQRDVPMSNSSRLFLTKNLKREVCNF
jgi:hypothetical protein